MPILEITTLHEPGLDAQTVDKFYYSNHPPNQLRAMTAMMIREGKILARFVALQEPGDTVLIYTIFKDNAARLEWRAHPSHVSAQEGWKDRMWQGETKVIPIRDMIDVEQWWDKKTGGK